MANPTLKQIADRVGVDRSTVSLALRNDRRLRPETCARIQKMAAQMGYRTNPIMAQLMAQLRSGQSAHFKANIALIEFSKSSNELSQVLFREIKERAWTMGYGVEKFHAYEMTAEQLERIFTYRNIRGLIFCAPWRDTELPKSFQPMLDRFSNCIIGVHPSSPQMQFVSDDHYFDALLAVRKLREAGFRQIGLALHEGINIETESRFVGGYLAGHFESPALKHPPVLLLNPEDREPFLAWFRKTRPDVVICIQQELLAWLQEANFRVPEDVSLVHLDLDATDGRWAGIRQNLSARGIAAVDIVISQLVHNERGVPPISKGQMMAGKWCQGSTLGMPPIRKV